MKNIDVSVIVITYNQEKWIEKTLESILSQKTNYKYEIIIGEDFSSDNTRKICQEYVDKYENVLLTEQDSNLGVVGNFANCLKQCKGKYIMVCAGDDYWHNSEKLQLQVEFMELHPNTVVCHTDVNILNEHTGKIIQEYNKIKNITPPEGRIQKDVIAGKECIRAVTMCIRRDCIFQYCDFEKWIELGFPREDWPMLFILSAYGNINYIPISTATYRVGQESITNTLSYDKIRKRYQQDKIMTEYLYSLFPELGEFKDGWWYDTHVYHSLLVAAYHNNDYKSAKEFAKNDITNTLSKKCACNWLFFQLYRIYNRYF